LSVQWRRYVAHINTLPLVRRGTNGFLDGFTVLEVHASVVARVARRCIIAPKLPDANV